MTQLTEIEKEALQLLKENESKEHEKMAEELDVLPSELSDIMRSLRYKGEVKFTLENGFEIDN